MGQGFVTWTKDVFNNASLNPPHLCRFQLGVSHALFGPIPRHWPSPRPGPFFINIGRFNLEPTFTHLKHPASLLSAVGYDRELHPCRGLHACGREGLCVCTSFQGMAMV